MRSTYVISLGLVAAVCGSSSVVDGKDFAYESAWVSGLEKGYIDADILGLPGDWWIAKQELKNGKQDGVEVLVLHNGKLELRIVPTRGMSIWDVKYEDLRIGWDSPVKEIVHPKYVNLEARGGLGWLEGFGGWLVRCGLEYAGLPGTDEAPTNTGEIVPMDLTLHGKIDYIPASHVSITVEKAPPHRLTISGITHEQMMFGPNFTLQTEITTKPDSLQFEVFDSVQNNSGHDAEMEMIYHLNFGRPLLEEGARFIAPVDRVTPRDERAAEGIREFYQYGPPEPGYVEQVYYLKPRVDRAGMTQILLRNADGDRGIGIRYSVENLPCLSLWKNTAAEADGYVTGIEPGTNYPNNRKIERKNNRVRKLQPGEDREFHLRFEVAPNAEAVQTIEEKIENLQGDEAVRMDSEPVEGISY